MTGRLGTAEASCGSASAMAARGSSSVDHAGSPSHRQLSRTSRSAARTQGRIVAHALRCLPVCRRIRQMCRREEAGQPWRWSRFARWSSTTRCSTDSRNRPPVSPAFGDRDRSPGRSGCRFGLCHPWSRSNASLSGRAPMRARPKLLHSGAMKLSAAERPACAQGFRHVRRGLNHGIAPATKPGNHQRPLRAFQRARDHLGQIPDLSA